MEIVTGNIRYRIGILQACLFYQVWFVLPDNFACENVLLYFFPKFALPKYVCASSQNSLVLN